MKMPLTTLCLLAALTSARAQTFAKQEVEARAAYALPDAPGVSPTVDHSLPATDLVWSEPQISSVPRQPKRVLWIIPDFRPVSADTVLPPQLPRQKLTSGLQNSFDYSSFILVGAEAGLSQATNAYPQFRQGAKGYGRYYWHTFADHADEDLLVQSVLPIVLRQDNRYYTLGRGGFVRRTGYALSRMLITRNDNGVETFNASEIVGAGAAAGISSTYYPGHYRTWTKTGQRWLANVLLDGGVFVVKEFGSDINRTVFRRKE